MAKSNKGHAFAVRMAKARAAKKRHPHHTTKHDHHPKPHHKPKPKPAKRHHARCSHELSRKVVVGAPAKWCVHCGAVWDGARWHHASHKR